MFFVAASWYFPCALLPRTYLWPSDRPKRKESPKKPHREQRGIWVCLPSAFWGVTAGSDAPLDHARIARCLPRTRGGISFVFSLRSLASGVSAPARIPERTGSTSPWPSRACTVTWAVVVEFGNSQFGGRELYSPYVYFRAKIYTCGFLWAANQYHLDSSAHFFECPVGIGQVIVKIRKRLFFYLWGIP